MTAEVPLAPEYAGPMGATDTIQTAEIGLPLRVRVGRIVTTGTILGASALAAWGGNVLSQFSSEQAEAGLAAAEQRLAGAQAAHATTEAQLGVACAHALREYVYGAGVAQKPERVAERLPEGICGETDAQQRHDLMTARASAGSLVYYQERADQARQLFAEREYTTVPRDRLTWLGGILGATIVGFGWVARRLFGEMHPKETAKL